MGEQRQGDVAVPGVVAAHLVLVQPHLALGLREALLNRPAPPRYLYQLVHRRAGWSKHAVVGEFLWVAHAAACQQPLRFARHRGVGQAQTSPVVPAWPLAALSGYAPYPGVAAPPLHHAA